MTRGQRFFRGSPCSSSSLLFFSSFLFLAANGPTTTAGPVQCNDAAGNYTANGTFQANLGRLLASLSANTSATGYFNDTEGRAPDQLVFGHATCRGDLSEAACRDCVTKAAGDTLRYCPNRRAVTAWYDDTCLLRYAGESFFGSPTGLQYVVFLTARVSDQQFAAYNQVLGGLMDRVAADAVRSPRKFAVGEANFTSFGKLYGMAQCTRDLGADGCDSCLRGEISTIPNNQCNGTRGCTVLGASCVIRFNENRFYSATTAADPSPPPPPPLQAPPSGNPPEVPDTPSSNKKTTSNIALAVAIPLLAAALVIACLSSFTLCWRKKRKANSHDGVDADGLKPEEFRVFDLETLKAATNNFSYANKLGEGGFGPVYKGVLLDGQEIAVKRLSTGSTQGLAELRNEVVLVAKLHHRNLVRLLGCCLEHEKLLVYEFLPNKSLDRFLFDAWRRKQLSWGTRYKIIQGLARGLQYLHEDSQLKVIHRDLKASNILLDGDMQPKISDFGLAKLFGRDQSQANASRIAGTFGYMAPEYVMNKHTSTRSDVYSFGVLVLEIVTGRRCTFVENSDRPMDLTSYVRQHWVQGDILEVLDRGLAEGCSTEEVKRCIHIGLLCADDDPYVRPDMSTVVLALSNQTMSLPNISVVDRSTSASTGD